MNIEFGIVKEYLSDKGVGFVSKTFSAENKSEVFFHIETIKKTNANLVEKLNNLKPEETICFWYEVEHTTKRDQVCNVLDSGVIHNIDNLTAIFEKVENIWNDLDSVIPAWLRKVTSDLVGDDDHANEIYLEREALEKAHKEEKRKKLEAFFWDTLGEKPKKLPNQESVENKEFERLVQEIKTLGYTHSKQVSEYIRKNQLGAKYKNISGILLMEQEGNIWQFDGGFPPKIYAKLCEELGLSNQGSRARALAFTPFKDLKT